MKIKMRVSFLDYVRLHTFCSMTHTSRVHVLLSLLLKADVSLKETAGNLKNKPILKAIAVENLFRFKIMSITIWKN